MNLNSLPRYRGPAWRAASGYNHGFTDTAADVVRFEAEELGNEWPEQLSPELQLELRSIPASQIVWVARQKETAQIYGPAELWTLSDQARIIHEDEDGALVWDPLTRSAARSAAPKANDIPIVPQQIQPIYQPRRAFNLHRTLHRTLHASRLTLPKLRQLFDDACQGMLDEDLLNEVYSEWHDFLGKQLQKYEVKRKVMRAQLRKLEAQGVSLQSQAIYAWLQDHQKIMPKLRQAWESLDTHYAAAPRTKLLALNKAIQIWHWGGSELTNYMESQGDDGVIMHSEVQQFLNWLSERRGRMEKVPPKPIKQAQSNCTYYHVTPLANWKSIQATGLRPATGSRSNQIGEPLAIFLFNSLTSLENALMNWLGEEFDENEKLAILAVNLPSNFPGLQPGEAGYEWLCTTPIPPEHIALASIDDGGSDPLPTKTASVQFYRGLTTADVKFYQRHGYFPKSDVPVFCDWEVMEYEGANQESFEAEADAWEKHNRGPWLNVTSDASNASGYGPTLIWVDQTLVEPTSSGQYGVVKQPLITRKTQGRNWDFVPDKTSGNPTSGNPSGAESLYRQLQQHGPFYHYTKQPGFRPNRRHHSQSLVSSDGLFISKNPARWKGWAQQNGYGYLATVDPSAITAADIERSQPNGAWGNDEEVYIPPQLVHKVKVLKVQPIGRQQQRQAANPIRQQRQAAEDDDDSRNCALWNNQPVYGGVYDRADGQILWMETYEYFDDYGWDHTEFLPEKHYDGVASGEKAGFFVEPWPQISPWIGSTGNAKSFRERSEILQAVRRQLQPRPAVAVKQAARRPTETVEQLAQEFSQTPMSQHQKLLNQKGYPLSEWPAPFRWPKKTACKTACNTACNLHYLLLRGCKTPVQSDKPEQQDNQDNQNNQERHEKRLGRLGLGLGRRRNGLLLPSQTRTTAPR